MTTNQNIQVGCCSDDGTAHIHAGPDYFLRVTASVVAAGAAVHLAGLDVAYLSSFAHAVWSLLGTMWWGIAAGIVAVGLLHRVPRDYFIALLGRGGTFGGLVRAALAGVLLDLCSHGILMVGAKLYERGVSLPQVMTFLISSPWNSFSLTFILIALIGVKWTLVFIAGSVVIALLTGWLYLLLEKKGALPPNPNAAMPVAGDFDMRADIKARLKNFRPGGSFVLDVLRDGLREGRMVIRWLFFGLIIAALIRAFVPDEMLTAFFGPTVLGLLLTMLATTVIEVCSEGSAPVGAELVTRAAAPGNGFAFLMGGVATDYTEILVIRQFTGRWKTAFLLPLLTLPQVFVLGLLMNAL